MQTATLLDDKRRDYDPHLLANVYYKRAHKGVIGALLRFAKVCDERGVFIEEADKLIKKLLIQGFERRELSRNTPRFANNHEEHLRKLDLHEETLLDHLRLRRQRAKL